MTDPALLDLEGLRAALAAGSLDPLEVVAALAERGRAAHAHSHCYLVLDEAGALAQARRLHQRRAGGRPGGALWGVPYAHKDVFFTPGRQPTAGSRFSGLPVSSAGPSALTALEGADAIRLGALGLDEISYGATGLNEHHGNCLNPWDTRYISGGSSSGAAAAVAARAIPFAIGSDTAGSTRIPAALCGVVGFKPTFGRLSTGGMVPLSRSQDTLGVIARSVRDCAVVTDALDDRGGLAAAIDALPRGRQPLAGLRLGLCRHPFFALQANGAEAMLDQALRTFETQGARVLDLTLSGIDDCDAAAAVITWVEVRDSYAALLRSEPEGFSGATRIRLETAMAPSADDYRRARAHRGPALQAFLDSAFGQADVLIAPTVTIDTPAIALLDDPRESVKATTALLRSNRCISYLGLPALSIPVGFGAHGLPFGLQLIGRPWAEAALLRCGAAYQGVTDWHRQVPLLTGPHQ